MLSQFYQKNIIDKPKLVILLLFLCLIGFGYYSKKLQIHRCFIKIRYNGKF